MLEIDITHIIFAIMNLALLVLIALWIVNYIRNGANHINSNRRIEEKIDEILQKLGDKK